MAYVTVQATFTLSECRVGPARWLDMAGVTGPRRPNRKLGKSVCSTGHHQQETKAQVEAVIRVAKNGHFSGLPAATHASKASIKSPSSIGPPRGINNVLFLAKR